MDEIYKMKLHDVLTPGGDCLISIMRVPGGWVYRFFEPNGIDGPYYINSVFVPYNNEFQGE